MIGLWKVTKKSMILLVNFNERLILGTFNKKVKRVILISSCLLAGFVMKEKKKKKENMENSNK